MSATQPRTAGRAGIVSATQRVWQAAKATSNWLDGRSDEPYSPLVCVSTLLLVGFIVKFSPALHSYLTQN
jgi:hypothetical protein